MARNRDLSKLLSTSNGKIAGTNLDVSFENINDTGTEGTRVAVGTTAQRGSTAGQFRFNSTTGLAEYFDGSSFKSIDSPPEITGISPTSIDESDLTANQTITITGSNISINPVVKIIGNDNTEINPASTTRNSASQVTITTPTSGLTAANEPYKIQITNVSGLAKTSSLSFSINDKPVFSTPAGSLGTLSHGNRAGSGLTQVAATDEESDSITFAVTSGSIPAGLTFNSDGSFSGTATAVSSQTTSSFTITATSGGQTATRNFTATINPPPVVEYLVVAGGGGGGSAENSHYGRSGGGGGAGGLRNSYASENSGGGASGENTLTFTAGTIYTITIGSGGAGRSGGSVTSGGDGSSSSISGSDITDVTTTGGGGGGFGRYNNGGGGRGGGSGGGGGVAHTGSGGPGGSGTAGEGFAGGSSNGLSNNSAGGGGGAAQVGEQAETDGGSYGGDGGSGLQSSISGTATYYAGGGGGGSDNGTGKQGNGGLGGGGDGHQSGVHGVAGTANTGGGGGGGGDNSSANSGQGGSGCVTLRLLASDFSGTTTGSPTITDDGIFKVIKFSGTGSITG